MTATPAKPTVDAAAAPAEKPRTSRFWLVARLALFAFLALSATFGGPVVRLAALCALPLALLADWDGGLRHIMRVVGTFAAVWLAPSLGTWLGGAIGAVWTMPPALANAVGILLLAVILVALAGLAGRRLTRSLRRRPGVNGANHLLGGVLGTAEGVVLVLSACWLLAAFDGPLAALRAQTDARQSPAGYQLLTGLADMRAAMEQDAAGRWLVRTNPLDDVSAVQDVQLLAEAVADPGRLAATMDGSGAGKLRELPEIKPYVQALENDDGFREALERGDLSAVLNNPHVRAMLNDPELRRALLARRREIRSALGQVHDSELRSAAGGGQ